MKKAAVAFLLATASVLALAQNATPAGLWKTIDDDGKTEKSLVRITNDNGVYTGKVEKIFDPAKADAKCDKCDDDRKDKPIVGMTIINGVKQDAEENNLFDGGQILDPANGKTYRVRLKPTEGGKKLEVRGYIGTPMLGRTQTWIRAE
ncbi:MAG TPA: DUF2147 domain-containing protein [Burkholderiaceae bacterium]